MRAAVKVLVLSDVQELERFGCLAKIKYNPGPIPGTANGQPSTTGSNRGGKP